MNPLSQSVEPETVVVAESPSKQVEETVECCIFLDNHSLVDRIGCSNGHWVSKLALGKYIDTELEKPIEYHQALNGVKCPACTETFAGERLLEMLSPEMKVKYATLRSKCSEKEQYEEEVAAKKPEDLEVLHESIRLQFRDGKGNYTRSVKMCPICNFGPIDHFACDALRTHHRQRIADGVHINNSCPVCGCFQSDIKRWTKWDGSFLAQERVDVLTEVKNSHFAKFEKFQNRLAAKFKQYEEDSKLLNSKFQEDLAQFKKDLQAWENYYPSHGVRAPQVVRIEMSSAQGQKKLELAREFRKAFRLWNKRPVMPVEPTARTAEQWLGQKKQKHKQLTREKEKEMFKRIEADIKQLDLNQAGIRVEDSATAV